jgi:hypothetical protein
MAVRLSALRDGRPLSPTAALYPPRRFLVLISVRCSVDPRAIVRLEGLSQLKIQWSQVAYSKYDVSSKIVFRQTLLFAFLLLLCKHYLLTSGAESFFRSRQLCSHSRTSQHFMEPEGSSPCSQEPHTGPCPEPDRSSTYHPILPSQIDPVHTILSYLSKIYFNIVHPPTSWSS